MDSPQIPAEAAAWIAATVLTRRYLDSCGGLDLVRLCCCQYGRCGHCSLGRHDQCTTRNGHAGRPPASPATHLLARAGHVVAEVWATGTPCAWRCPCGDCPTRIPATEPAPYVLALEQLDLFALEGAV
uniref:DUF6248 family natural product biosynthesis protein n=1 Tax=Actinoplanes sp. CA-084688 TaxID=3239901 RepID=UPI003F494A1D